MACHLQIDADPDPDPAYYFDADPEPDSNFQFNADPDLQHSLLTVLSLEYSYSFWMISFRYGTLCERFLI